MMYKIMNKLSLGSLWDKFELRSVHSKYETRNCHNGFKYSALKLWYDTPVDIREALTLKCFK